MKYTQEEEQFLIQNYPIYGSRYCSNVLKRDFRTVSNKARSLGLKAGRKKHDSNQKVPTSQFLNIKTKEVAYFLGFFWADGYIRHYKVGNCNHWRIVLEIVEKDAVNISNILDRLGKWIIVKRNRKDSWQTTWSFVTANEDLYNFLKEHGYEEKSTIEPTKILSKIPEEFKYYFWKGFIDGDGHISIKDYEYQISLTFELSGKIDYEWSEIKKVFDKLNITKYYIYKQTSKKDHKSSVLRINGKEIIKLKPIFVNFGLDRKTEQFSKIENYLKEKNEKLYKKPTSKT